MDVTHFRNRRHLIRSLVGSPDQCRRQIKAKRLGGLQIDDQQEFGRLIIRDVDRFGSARI